MDTMPAGPGSVSHYRLLSKIGAGGMGEVWLAEDTQLPRKVAVKLLPRDAARDPQAVARLLRRARSEGRRLRSGEPERGRGADQPGLRHRNPVDDEPRTGDGPSCGQSIRLVGARSRTLRRTHRPGALCGRDALASRIFGRRLAATATELVPAGGHARSRPGRDQIAAQGPRSAVRAGGGSPRRPSCLPGRVERRGARASEAPRTARRGALLRGARLFTGGWLPRSRFDRRSDRRSDTPGRIARRLARGRPRLSRQRRATAYAGT